MRKPKEKPAHALKTVGEVAEIFDISQSTVIRMIISGSLPAICLKSGKRKKIWRVRPEALENWMRARERETQRAPKLSVAS